ncbi:MAG: hypothetical protein M3Z64_06120 [Verrucomicrobiota bacterium]|nr:hypothetical protein [Verrucomicrobiota bacterium]
MKDPAKLSGGRTHVAPPIAVIGLEAEFTLYVDEVKRRPEHVFGTPQQLISEKMLPRTGRSFQLPAGGAIYFDTGVIEVATPIVELGPGCCYRATRLLWEQIRYVRQELNRWSLRHNCTARLEGFSTHYNFSFTKSTRGSRRTAHRLGHLLAHILPAPVLLLAANRKSTAVGVRPRGTRIEVTTDFTPDAALMLATCAFVAGAAETASTWPTYHLDQLPAHNIPRFAPFQLRKHSSRRGWRVLATSLAHDPFASDVNLPIWRLRDGRQLSLRNIASETARPFRRDIRRLSDLETLQHIEAIFKGDARSLLDFPERPKSYEDAGHAFDWGRRRVRHWPRSAYEKVIHHVIAREPIRVGGKRYTVQRMQGWYEVVCRESKTNRDCIFNLDELAKLVARRRRARRKL